MARYSRRFDEIPPYLFGEIARLKAQAIAEGKDLIDFGIGDPDQPTPRPIIAKLAELAADPRYHRYDESNYGWPEFLDSAAKWFEKRFGVALDPSSGEMLEVIGSKEALAHLAWAFLDVGDFALVPDPGYPVYRANVSMAGGTPYLMPLLAENSFLPDLTDIPAEVARKAKLMYINYPNNPTGATATLDFFREVVEFARKYEIIVCHDAAYAEVGFDGYKAPSFMQVPGAKDIGIEMHSLSKAYNMTGWRIGFAVGDPFIVKGLEKIKSNIDSKQFPAIAGAAGYALENIHGNPQTLALYQKRRDVLIAGLNSLGWNLPLTKATLYVWIPIPPGHTSKDFAMMLLEKASVCVIPGTGYGQYGEGYVRLSMTVSGDKNAERVEEAIERIRENVDIRW